MLTRTSPPVTTDRINVWNVNITSGVGSSVIQVTRSILPPPFTITDDRNPRSQSGVTNPVVTRTITPPPFPYPKSELILPPRRVGTSSTLATSSGVVFPYPTTSGYLYPPQWDCPECKDPPSVTHSSGDPKNPCKTRCGAPCNPAVAVAAAIPGPLGVIASAAASKA